MEENSLTNRSRAVCVEDELSSPLPVISGVPQGSILGPVLLILYINDLPSCIQFSNIMMYADHTVIYLSSTTTLDIELKLNLDLVNLSQWLHHMYMYICSQHEEDGIHDVRHPPTTCETKV